MRSKCGLRRNFDNCSVYIRARFRTRFGGEKVTKGCVLSTQVTSQHFAANKTYIFVILINIKKINAYLKEGDSVTWLCSRQYSTAGVNKCTVWGCLGRDTSVLWTERHGSFTK